MKPTFAVTGAAGQLGRELIRQLGAGGFEATALDRATLDVTDPVAVAAAIAALRPDVIVNCAAATAVDACEHDPESALRVNADAVAALRCAADACGAHLVQLSTDYVFDGWAQRPYRPDDEPNPLSVYGRTKRIGEMAAGPESTIVRTSWVCSADGTNMVTTVRRLLAAGQQRFAFVDDQRGRPTFVADLAAALVLLGRDRVPGTLHVTNATDNDNGVTWCEFVREIVRVSGGDPAIVDPIATADLDPPRPAARPANGVLDGGAYAALGYPPPRHYLDALADL